MTRLVRRSTGTARSSSSGRAAGVPWTVPGHPGPGNAAAADGPLAGLTVVATGSLEGFSREGAQEAIIARGRQGGIQRLEEDRLRRGRAGRRIEARQGGRAGRAHHRRGPVRAAARRRGRRRSTTSRELARAAATSSCHPTVAQWGTAAAYKPPRHGVVASRSFYPRKRDSVPLSGDNSSENAPIFGLNRGLVPHSGCISHPRMRSCGTESQLGGIRTHAGQETTRLLVDVTAILSTSSALGTVDEAFSVPESLRVTISAASSMTTEQLSWLHALDAERACASAGPLSLPLSSPVGSILTRTSAPSPARSTSSAARVPLARAALAARRRTARPARAAQPQPSSATS